MRHVTQTLPWPHITKQRIRSSQLSALHNLKQHSTPSAALLALTLAASRAGNLTQASKLFPGLAISRALVVRTAAACGRAFVRAPLPAAPASSLWWRPPFHSRVQQPATTSSHHHSMGKRRASKAKAKAEEETASELDMEEEPTTPKRKRKQEAAPAGIELETPDKTPPKPRNLSSKAKRGQAAAEALASQGELESVFLLYDAYPHARAFTQPSIELPAAQSEGPGSPATAGTPIPAPGSTHTPIKYRLTHGVFTSVLTYHAEDSVLVEQHSSNVESKDVKLSAQGGPVGTTDAGGSAAQPAGTSTQPASDTPQVAAAVVEDPAEHHPQRDEEELPEEVKVAVRDTAKRRKSSKNKKAKAKAESSSDAQDDGSTLDAMELARQVENVAPLAVALDVTVPDNVEFNKPLRDKPWPAVVPNLGYACLCATLRAYDVHCSRDCIQATFLSKGLPHVSSLALANAKDLVALIRWNARHGIQLFRLSSGIFPWMTKYNLEELPDIQQIKEALKAAGDAARAAGQRLTFHPSEFCKIAGADDRDHWTDQSVAELEVHSKIFDMMGYEPSHWNKINIHVGGSYGDKDATLRRFAKVVNEKLSANCKARLTVENDDKGSLYSVKDLLLVHELCGIPITFDFHHHKFCTGGWDELTAFKAAMATWPEGVRPVVHWSEARDDRRAQAHSDYVYGPIYLHGYERDVDVMIESKAKELALLRYREMAIHKAAAQAPQSQ